MRFQFQLARELGMTVGELKDRITDEEFVWWQQYFLRLHDEEIERS